MVVVHWSQCHIVVRPPYGRGALVSMSYCCGHPYGRGALVSMSYCCEAPIWSWCTGLNVILL